MARTGFEKLRVYHLAEEIADLTWEVVVKWSWLAQNTVGKQLINAADSIGAISLKEQGAAVMLRTGDLLRLQEGLYSK